jgi:hypothetical protein
LSYAGVLASSGDRIQMPGRISKLASTGAIPVDLGAQQAEEGGHELDFIQVHQVMPMGLEEQLRLLELGSIAAVLQVEHYGITLLGQQLAGQGGFATLPGQITVHFCSVGTKSHGSLRRRWACIRSTQLHAAGTRDRCRPNPSVGRLRRPDRPGHQQAGPLPGQ